MQKRVPHEGSRMKRGPATRIEPTDRERSMAADYRSGKTLHEIGQAHGVTRERVRQLLTKRFGITAKDGGLHKKAKRNAIIRAAAKDEYSLKKWGCTWAQYQMLRATKGRPTYRFGQQRKNADIRGIAWDLTLWQWWTIWQDSGHWEQRGRGNGYVMCRKGDVGPYSVDNVVIDRGNLNSFEAQKKKSGLPIGVRAAKTPNRYEAKRCIGGQIKHLGTFPTPEQAAAAYLAADPLPQVAA